MKNKTTNLDAMIGNKAYLVDVLSKIENDDPLFINDVSSAVCDACPYGENGDRTCVPGDGNDCKNPLTFEESITIWLDKEI